MATKKPTAAQRAAARKEQEKAQRRVRRTCRGPLMFTEKAIVAKLATWRDLLGRAKPAELVDAFMEHQRAAQKVALPGFTVPVPQLVVDMAGELKAGRKVALTADGLGELNRAARPLIKLRAQTVGKPCGYDHTEEVLKHPFDGAEHVSECPRCGVERSWRAPIYY